MSSKSNQKKEGIFKKFTNGCVTIVSKYLPDSFLFAIILTIIVFVLGMILTKQSPIGMTVHWGKGFWNLLAFTMQMVLVCVTGSAMAQAPFFKKLLAKIASIPNTPVQAVMITTFVSIIANWINWGFGLIIGALLAKEMAKKVKGCDYRLLIAMGYTGLVVWHGGMAGSIPLTLASSPTLEAATAGALTQNISAEYTLFAPMNLFIVIAFLIVMPIVSRFMQPSPDEVVEIDPALLVDNERVYDEPKTPAEKLERSKILWALTLILGFAYLIYYFANSTSIFSALGLDIVNYMFMMFGILLHGSLRRYIDAVADATKGASGIILQFPFYAGIMGMMTGLSPEGVSLASVISNAFVSISTPTTFPLFTFLSAGVVNFFVPSGGGQWAVQAPIMMPAARELGVSMADTAMAIAWGDAWTNMIQPFWILPVLGVAGLGAKDVMGYCVISLLVSGVICCIGFLLFTGMVPVF